MAKRLVNFSLIMGIVFTSKDGEHLAQSPHEVPHSSMKKPYPIGIFINDVSTYFFLFHYVTRA